MPARSATALLLVVGLCFVAGPVPPAGAAVFEPREFADPAHAARYRRLVEELRCLVCQNQNLADSDADLAGDLRNEVYRMVAAGGTESEVVAYLVDRYGDFVRYRPPLNVATLALWAGPFALGIAGVLVLLGTVRRRAGKGRTDAALDAEASARADALLRGEPGRSAD